MRHRTSLHLVAVGLACVTVSGCEGLQQKLFQKAGGLVAHQVAPAAARVVPVKTETKVEPKGGSFCRVIVALGWPGFRPPPAMIDATPDREANVLADTLEYADKHCPGWAGPAP